MKTKKLDKFKAVVEQKDLADIGGWEDVGCDVKFAIAESIEKIIEDTLDKKFTKRVEKLAQDFYEAGIRETEVRFNSDPENLLEYGCTEASGAYGSSTTVSFDDFLDFIEWCDPETQRQWSKLFTDASKRLAEHADKSEAGEDYISLA